MFCQIYVIIIASIKSDQQFSPSHHDFLDFLQHKISLSFILTSVCLYLSDEFTAQVSDFLRIKILLKNFSQKTYFPIVRKNYYLI